MILRKLSITDQRAYLDYLQDWEEEHDVIPASNKMSGLSFESFLIELKKRESHEQAFPDETYVLVDESGQIYGALNLRLKLDRVQTLYEGHIGYGISPKHRGHGYGNLILDLGLASCREKGFEKVLITVNEENHRSEHIIQTHGGVLINKVYKTDGYIHRYWIAL